MRVEEKREANAVRETEENAKTWACLEIETLMLNKTGCQFKKEECR